MIRRLAIVGIGLLGGSVAKAARAHGLATEIVGIGRDLGRLEPARRDGTLDRVTTDVAAGLRDADLVVLASPVAIIAAMLAEVAAACRPETIVTDVGSTKAAIVRAAERVARRYPLRFVGSHPMAGSEKSGYAHARADLFRGATVVITPTETSDPVAVKTVGELWERLGADRVVTLDPDAHDRAAAAISHLPHLVAMALVDTVDRFEPGALDIAARGYRDTTRIAASDPVMWEEIFLANRDALGQSLVAFREALAELERLVAAGDGAAVRAAIARIKARRETLS